MFQVPLWLRVSCIPVDYFTYYSISLNRSVWRQLLFIFNKPYHKFVLSINKILHSKHAISELLIRRQRLYVLCLHHHITVLIALFSIVIKTLAMALGSITSSYSQTWIEHREIVYIMGFYGAYNYYGLCARSQDSLLSVSVRRVRVVLSTLLELRAEESRVLRHVKPPALRRGIQKASPT